MSAQLNPAQRAAVTRLGQDICVVAGPGTGKTRVLVERFRWLVDNRDIAPERILAITFTEEAAAQMKQRLVEAFAGQPERQRRIERAWISTIHSFCARLLREHALEAGVDGNFQVLDEVRSRDLMLRTGEEILERLYQAEPDRFRKLLSAMDFASVATRYKADLVRELVDVYQRLRIARKKPEGLGAVDSGCRELIQELTDQVRAFACCRIEGQTGTARALRTIQRQLQGAICWLEELSQREPRREDLEFAQRLDFDLPNRSPYNTELRKIRDLLRTHLPAALISPLLAPVREIVIEILQQFDHCYRQAKAELAGLDFTDLEERALDLLEDPKVRQRVQSRFDFILMDELQDTNPLQWQIVERLRRPGRLFAVGDINQAIYGFRHATPELFRAFRRELENKGHAIDRLEINYRSVPPILRLANLLAGQVEGLEPVTLQPGRAATGEPGVEAPIEVAVVRSEETAKGAEWEARWVARRIVELAQEEARKWDDFAVLARKRELLVRVQEALREAGIPCVVVGGDTLLETREARDLMLALAVLANPLDDVALAGILRSPLVQLSDAVLFELRQKAQGKGRLWKAVTAFASENAAVEVPAEEAARLGEFCELVTRLRASRHLISADRLLAQWLDQSGYYAALDPQARANVDRLLELLVELTGGRPVPLRRLVEQCSLLRAAGKVAEAPPPEVRDRVRLMTVHAAKGLEFPVVFLVGLQSRKGTDRPLLRFEGGYGLGIRWKHPSKSEKLPDLAYLQAEQQQKQREREEEARLFYVAVTRAQDRLMLSWVEPRRNRQDCWRALFLEACQVDHQQEGLHEVKGIPVQVWHLDAQPELPAVPPARPSGEASGLKICPPGASGQYDGAVSVTALGEFMTCPRRYYLARYLNLEDLAEDARPSEFGDESLSRGKDIGTIAHKLLAGVELQDAPEEARQLAQAFEDTALAQRARQANRRFTEYDFAIALEDVVLQGQIDLWFEDAGGIVIVDYKTDSKLPAPGSPRREEYEFQLRCYARALEQLLEVPVSEAYLAFLRQRKVEPVSVGCDHLHFLRDLVARWKRAQEESDFPPRQTEECYWCPFEGSLCGRR